MLYLCPRLCCIVVLVVIGSTSGAEPAAKWLEPTDEHVTPHIKWAKPSSQGALKVLYITYRLGMREVVEISQRFEIEREVFAIELPHRFSGGVESGQIKVFGGTTPDDQQRRLREKLDQDYDCIVIGNIPWNLLPQWSRKTILEKVANGTGLVGFLHDGADLQFFIKDRYKTLDGVNRAYNTKYTAWDQIVALGPDDPLAKALSSSSEHLRPRVLGAYPFAGLPAFQKYSDFDGFAAGTLQLAQLGKGRIALLKGFSSTTYQILTPAITGSFTDWHLVHYDYYLALAGHVLHWAADRQPDVHIEPGDRAIIEVDRTGLSQVSFRLEAESPGDVELEFALRHNESGEVLQRATKSESLHRQVNTIAFDLVPVPAGRYFADLWVRRAGKTVCFGSHLISVTSRSSIAEVVLVGDHFETGDLIKNYSLTDTITGHVSLTGTGDDLTLEINQRDNYQRLIAQQTLPVTSAKVEFTLHPLEPLTTVQWVDVRLLQGDTVLDEQRKSFTYNDLYPFEPGEDVYFVLWQGHTGDGYLNAHLCKIISEAGFDIYHSQFCFDPKLLSVGPLLRANLHEFPSFHYPSPVRPRLWGDPISVEGGGHIRKPCLTDPEIMKVVDQTYRQAAQTCRKYSTLFYHLGSECEFTGHAGQEICFSPTCIQHFHNYLEAEYGSIDALNEEYESSYLDWNEIRPITFDTAKVNGQVPLWMDFRRAMDTVWANLFARARQTISEVTPGGKVGTAASHDPGHVPKLGGIGGDDYWKLYQSMSLTIPYFNPNVLDTLRDFAEPSTLTGTIYGGYMGVFRAGRNGPWHRWLIWYTLLRGMNSFHVWQGSGMSSGEIVGTTIAPDFSWYDFMEWNNRTMKELKAGPGKLLLAMDRPHDGIAVLYSPASLLMTNFTENLPERWDSFVAVSAILPESNFQYRMISSDQLEGGILEQRGFRLLYLPYCQALSPTEVEQIRAFVKGGGSVLADLRPAVTDAHGKPYEIGALDDVFGVRQDTRQADQADGPVTLIPPLQANVDELPPTRTDASIELAGATALASVAGTPAIMVNDFGQGKAILLNFAISDYVLDKLMNHSGAAMRLVDEPTASKLAVLMRAVFAKCGVTPEISLSPNVGGCHLYRFKHGEVQLLGLLEEIPPFLPGVSERDEDKLDEISRTRKHEVTLSLNTIRHVYDVLEGSYLGRMRAIKRTVVPGEPHLLAALP